MALYQRQAGRETKTRNKKCKHSSGTVEHSNAPHAYQRVDDSALRSTPDTFGRRRPPVVRSVSSQYIAGGLNVSTQCTSWHATTTHRRHDEFAERRFAGPTDGPTGCVFGCVRARPRVCVDPTRGSDNSYVVPLSNLYHIWLHAAPRNVCLHQPPEFVRT